MECGVITKWLTCLQVEETNTIGETTGADGLNYRGGRELAREGVTKMECVGKAIKQIFR